MGVFNFQYVGSLFVAHDARDDVHGLSREESMVGVEGSVLQLLKDS